MRVAALIGALSAALVGCGSCAKEPAAEAPPVDEPVPLDPPPSVVKAGPSRCREDGARLALPSGEVVVGDVAIGPEGFLVGLLREAEGGGRAGAVLRASLDLTGAETVELGRAFGDDPPPSPRWDGSVARAAYVARRATDGGPKLRELRLFRLEGRAGALERAVEQQADESTAFDVAFGEFGGLAAWDEDAPLPPGAPKTRPPDRGLVKVQVLADGARPRVASPASSDVEAPRVMARPGGGFWLAWLARRAEAGADATDGPAERRAYRWVEAVTLSASGEASGPVRRVSPEDGRAVAFELASTGGELVVLVQDEAAPAEGAGARIVRHVVGADGQGAELVRGVGEELVDVPPASVEARWLAWADTDERAQLMPLTSALASAGPASREPLLDGARVLATGPGGLIYALVGADPARGGDAGAGTARAEVRRFVCAVDAGAP